MKRGPRKLSSALRQAAEAARPKTTLAAVQAAWSSAVGPEFAVRCEPVSERDGIVTVACESAVWAHELDLCQAEIVARLRRESGAEAVRTLRCRSGRDPS